MLQQSQGPTVEPVTVAEVRIHLRQGSDDPADPINDEAWGDDSWVADKITAAREAVESFLGRPITDATYVSVLDSFPGSLTLPNYVAAIVRVDYLDEDHAVQTLASSAYYYDPFSFQLFFVGEPPAISDRSSPVRVYCRGSGVATESERHAILLLIGSWYRNREAEGERGTTASLPPAAECLLRPGRIALGMA